MKKHPQTVFPSDVPPPLIVSGRNDLLLSSTDTPHGAPIVFREAPGVYWVQVVDLQGVRGASATLPTARKALAWLEEHCSNFLD